MPLLNEFLIGADPEFVIRNRGHLQVFNDPVDRLSPWGIDHGGYVIEPHPKPERSVRKFVDNIKVAMNDFATVAPTGPWQAGPYIESPEREIPLGGHVHVDQTNCSDEQRNALDKFVTYLEALDILPTSACKSRRDLGHYGRFGDVRYEHGHFEYRTFPSWLFSQRVTKTCLTGTKLIIIDPAAVREVLKTGDATKTKLKAFFERFKSKDEDAAWLVDSGMFDKNLSIDPTKDLRDVWRVTPKKEDPHWKATQVAQTAFPTGHNGRSLTLVVEGELHLFRVFNPEGETFAQREALRAYVRNGGAPDGRPVQIAGLTVQYRGREGNLMVN